MNYINYLQYEYAKSQIKIQNIIFIVLKQNPKNQVMYLLRVEVLIKKIMEMISIQKKQIQTISIIFNFKIIL